jgi:hypothetical protein
MTEPAETPQAAPPPEAPPAEPPARPRHGGLAWLLGLVLLVLAGSQAAQWYVTVYPLPRPDPLERRVQAVEARLARLEQRPVAAAPDLGPLEARVAALEKAPGPPPVVEQKPPPPAASPAQVEALAERLAADELHLAALEKAAAAPAQAADRAARIARIETASLALSAGRPLGDIPDAPPALARYATAAPPTEASLRLAFPAAARAALAAHVPPADKPFLDRLWAEAQELVTVRQGEHLLVGDPNAVVLAHAGTLLDAGDLAGAAAALGTLSGPAAAAMASWLDQANGLLAARAALLDMAARA